MLRIHVHVFTLLALYLALLPCRLLGARRGSGRDAQAAAGPLSLSQLTLRIKDKRQNGCGRLSEHLSSIVKVDGVIQSDGVTYTLQECLGAGSFGEVWLVQVSGGDSGPEAVVKILIDSDSFHGELALQEECDFAKSARNHVESGDVHITDCLGTGKLQTGRPFVVFERADGYELEGLLSKSESETIQTVLPDIGRVFLRLKQLHDFMGNLATVDQYGLRLFHQDLHPGNLFITKDYLTAIDYGLVHTCCQAKACGDDLCECEQELEKYTQCEDALDELLSANMFFFAVDTIALLIEIPPETELKEAVMDFAIARAENSGEYQVFQQQVKPQFRDQCSEGSVCDHALHSAALVMRGQQAMEDVGDLGKLIEDGSKQSGMSLLAVRAQVRIRP